MRISLKIFIAILCLSSCHTLKTDYSKMRSIDLFKIYITGDFNNEKQIAEEKAKGKQVHPYAVHVNRVADPIILNKPKVDGFWILEESYYTKPESSTIEVKPYLFLFESADSDRVKLTPYSLPQSINVNEIKNSNTQLRFNFEELKASPTFKPAYYTREGNIFKMNAPNDLPNGIRFTLTETITETQLIVMELLEKDGKRLTPYDTPIIYDRVKK